MDPNDDILNNTQPRNNNKDRVTLGTQGQPPAGDKLMAYLEGKLTPAEQHEIEQWLSEDGMESDAIEGLKNLPATETRHTVNKLDHQLATALKKRKRRKRETKPDQAMLVAVIIILLLSVVAYAVIKLAAHK